MGFMKTMVGTAASLALVGSVFANPYEEYAGSTLVVNFPAHPHYDAVMKVLPEFTCFQRRTTYSLISWRILPDSS